MPLGVVCILRDVVARSKSLVGCDRQVEVQREVHRSEAQTPLALVVPDRLDALAIGRHRLLRRDLIAATRSAHGLGGCPGPLEERGELPATTAHIVRSSALRSSRPSDTNVGVEALPLR